MVRRFSESEVLEWIITSAPEPDEAPLFVEAGFPSEAPLHAAGPRPLPFPLSQKFSRWLWLTLGSVIVLSLAGLGAYTTWNRFWVERALTLVTTGRRVRSLRDYWNYAWSPTGHTLVIGSNRSYDLLAEPGDARQEPQPLFTMTNECYQVFWNPKP